MGDARHNLFRAAVAVTVALTGVLTPTVAAASDDPPGTVRITPEGDGTVRDRVVVLTGELRNVIVTVQHRRDGADAALPGYRHLVALQPGREPEDLGQVPDDAGDDAVYSSVRNLVTHPVFSGGQERVVWWNLDLDTSGSVLLAGDRDYVTGAPGGFLVREGDHLQLQTTGGTVTDLGAPFPGVTAFGGRAGEDGAVLVPSADGTLAGAYLAFGEPGFTPLPATAGLSCENVVGGYAACWGVGPNRAVQVPVDGTRPALVVATRSRVDDVSVSGVDGSRLLWQTGPDATLRSTDYGSRAVQVDPTRYAPGLHLAFDGVVLSGTGEGRLFTTFSAAEAPTLFFGAARSPVAATSVALSPGRVVQVDDRQTGAPTPSSAFDTRLDTSAAELRLHATVVLRRGSFPLRAEASGTTTVAGTADFATTGNRVLSTPRGSTTIRRTLPDRTDRIGGGDLPGTDLSGNRYVFSRATSTGTKAYVYDATTGRTTLVQSGFGFGAGPPALSGDELAFVRRDGSVWRKNLVTGASVRLSAPRAYDRAQVFASGDLVGWNLSLGDEEHQTRVSAYRDARTLAPAQPLGSPILQLTTSGIVQQPADYTLLTRDGTTVPLLGGLGNGVPRVEGRTVAWIDSQGVAKVAPVDVAPAAPRFLGDPLAPAGIRHPGRPGWRSFAPYDAPLTSCSVTISSGTRVVRRLACGSPRMALGVAAFSWDGTVAGRPARPGLYTYRIAAGGDGGPARNVAGRALPVTRAIRLG